MVVLLHGFAGTGRTWDPVRALLPGPSSAPDLRGHGDNGAQRPITFADVTRDVLAGAPPRFVLAGYSMGGRIALHAALTAPERIEHLVLVATSAGLSDAHEQMTRAAADETLARFADTATLDAWIERWTATPLFAGDPEDAAAAWREDLRRSRPADLAAVLRGLGTGVMAPLWDRLHELAMPVTVLAGERDAKFTALGARLARAIPDAELIVVPGAGHGLPREAPDAVAAAISRPAGRRPPGP